MREPMIGDRVRVKSRHWLRANSEGIIEERPGPDSYQILFDNTIEFKGFDDGRRLILSMDQFQVIQEVIESGS